MCFFDRREIEGSDNYDENGTCVSNEDDNFEPNIPSDQSNHEGASSIDEGNFLDDIPEHNLSDYEDQEITCIFDNVEVEDMDIDVSDLDCENASYLGEENDDDELSTEDEVENCEEDKRKDSVPLYVLPPLDAMYSSKITHQEHLLSLCAYSTKNNLSGTAFSQLMQLINIHVPEKNLCELNVNKVKRKLGFTDFMKYVDFCEICGAIYSEAKEIIHCHTPNCPGRRNTDNNKGHGKNFFVTGDLSLQLSEILENNWENILSSLGRENVEDGIYDILDGKRYKEIKEKCKKMTITLTMFTDGVLYLNHQTFQFGQFI